MPDAVETMAYAGAVPWHRLGKKVPANLEPEKMLVEAGLDWDVSQHPVCVQIGTELVETDKIALVRDTDKRVLTISSKKWKPLQNREAFEFFKEFCAAGKATMETAGSLLGGRHVWALAKLGVNFVVDGHDRTEGYLLFHLPHEVGNSIKVQTTSIRVVCQNTLSFALEGDTSLSYSQSHVKKFDFGSAREVFGSARDNIAEQGKFSEALTEVEMKPTKAVKFYSEFSFFRETPLDPDQASYFLRHIENPRNSKTRLAGVYRSYKHADGANQNNAWGVLNGLTHYADHVVGRDPGRRLANSWFGEMAQIKKRAVERLKKMAR